MELEQAKGFVVGEAVVEVVGETVPAVVCGRVPT